MTEAINYADDYISRTYADAREMRHARALRNLQFIRYPLSEIREIIKSDGMGPVDELGDNIPYHLRVIGEMVEEMKGMGK